MLKFLHIENIAVIEKAGIEFSTGLNVLTGETGAGKSIIIDAIFAVLGHRTSKELIRGGCDSAFASAVLSSLPEQVGEYFKENGIKADDDGNFIIERKLSLSGAGYIKINGIPVTASFLKTIAPLIINIHGQHDNQALLEPDNHYLYIDRLAQNEAELNAYRNCFKEFNAIRSALKEREIDEDEKLRKIDLLKYQIKELKDADLSEGEIDELKAKLSVAKNVDKRIKDLNSVLSYLRDNGDSVGATTLVKNAVHSISLIADDGLNGEYEKMLDAVNNLEISAHAIEGRIEELSSEEYDIDKIQERLSLLKSLSLKYGKDEAAMLLFLANAEKELDGILFNDEEIERLENQLILAKEALIASADKLSKTRKKAALSFEKDVKEVLCRLNMPRACLSVEHNTGRYTRNGCDEIQFLFSANAGETKKALSKIASGGELSRVMLAIKSVLADKDEVDTLIFDEIDSGISGRTADMVGVQLKEVAGSHQVICVTHLAQIAVAAGHHLLITKEEKQGRTYTNVCAVEGEDRVYEIARIMGGTNVTDNVLASARELLNK
ncbi:MAG: DNA repair protein RecN [Clostridia bacterium]|nr:DNA repair protein RecN [Clostridia bacterium]